MNLRTRWALVGLIPVGAALVMGCKTPHPHGPTWSPTPTDAPTSIATTTTAPPSTSPAPTTTAVTSAPVVPVIAVTSATATPTPSVTLVAAQLPNTGAGDVPELVALGAGLLVVGGGMIRASRSRR